MSSIDPPLFDNVRLGSNVLVGPYVILGHPYPGMPKDTGTVIGDNSRIRSHTVIYAGNVIGSGFQTGHGAFLRECNDIGDNVSIGTKSIVEHHVKIGNDARIHSQVFIPEYSILDEGCWIGPNVVFTNARYPRSPNVKEEIIGPTIGKSAIIGANSTLLPGVVIGESAIIGAGSVVTRDVEAGMVVAGNPARVINHRDNLPYGE
jgi:acetyltransferase-like isoleucine patch superfamily enzyme